MDCNEFNRMLDNYENLSDAEMSALNDHAAECEACRGELALYRSMMLEIAALPALEPPADLIDKINSRIDNIPKRVSGYDRAMNSLKLHTGRYATIAACLAVGVIVGLNGKTISDRLTGGDTDGVIKTTVTVSDASGETTSEYEIIDSTESEELIPANAATQPPAPIINEPIKAVSAAVKPSVTASPQTKAAATASPAAATVRPTEAAVTELPAPTELPAKYTIARGNYYIPTAQPTTAPTEAPAAQSVDVEGERYQIAMGIYEISEEEKKELAKNKLVVNERDIDHVFELMRSAGIKGTTEGYTASEGALNTFLAMLDAEGLYYNYLECSQMNGEIIFRLYAN